MELRLASWPEVERYLESSKGILIPVGSTEQHGPNGLLGTDAICPEVVAKGVGEAVDAMVAPTLPIGMAQHHLSFAGTIALRPTTLLALVRDVVLSLQHHGFRHFYLLNGHGGNVATLNAAFSEVYTERSLESSAEGPGPLIRLRNWWSGQRVMRASRRLFGAADGAHATASEVSLSYYAFPEARKEVEMSPEVAPNGPIFDAHDFRRRFPDGRMGSNPALASVEAGKELYEAAVADTREDFLAFLAEEPA